MCWFMLWMAPFILYGWWRGVITPFIGEYTCLIVLFTILVQASLLLGVQIDSPWFIPLGSISLSLSAWIVNYFLPFAGHTSEPAE